jgi:hypothetical protein
VRVFYSAADEGECLRVGKVVPKAGPAPTSPEVHDFGKVGEPRRFGIVGGRVFFETSQTEQISFGGPPPEYTVEPAGLFRVEAGEVYIDAELITHRDFGCKAYEPGVPTA